MLSHIGILGSLIQEQWIICRLHSTCLYHMNCVKMHKHIHIADGTFLKVVGIGSIKLATIGLLTNVVYVPNIFLSLISVQKIVKKD